MATKTHPNPSTFSRVRFGLGPKQRLPPESPENENDSDWYLPYNGPYELPSTTPLSQSRDSWGQLLGSVLTNLGGTRPSEGLQEWSDGRLTSALPSSGMYASHPYRMNATPDLTGPPGSTTTAFKGRSTVSHSLRGGRPRLNTTSSTPFANIDTTGGVGESPTPVQRSSLPTSPPLSASSRLSLASILSFGGSTRKSRSDSAPIPRQGSRKRSRTGPPPHDLTSQSNHPTEQYARPSSSHSPVRLDPPPPVHRPRRRSNTLAGASMTSAQTSSHNFPPTFHNSDNPSSLHPYAYPFPSSWIETPRHAPVIQPVVSPSLDKGKSVDRSYQQYPRPPPPDTLNRTEVPAHLKPASRPSLLKTISAPNLRNLSRFTIGKPTSGRGKYRWLSPETWCDALLFPRPRFMAHTDEEFPPQPFSSHQRVPVLRSSEAHPGSERVTLSQTQLRASQSAVNLRAPNSESSPGPPRAEPMLREQIEGQSRQRRPRSFAQDDLALPSPVPSLARVLEMRASFERERAEWKAKAARSLQSSKLTRSLGRARSQSTGRTRAQLKDAGGLEYLATKTLLGNQLAAPTVHTSTSSDGTQTQHTRSCTSHARTPSSAGHSRAGSKNKSALRAATGLCISDDNMSPKEELFTRHDGEVKAVRVETSPPELDARTLPSPPVISDSSVGIAVSSPPLSPEKDATPTQPSGTIYVPDHPYAQSGGYSMPRRSHTRSSSDYAGAHPSAVSVSASATVLASDMSARHRLPPQLVPHPYASALADPSATSSSQHSTVLPLIPPKGPHETSSEHAPPRPKVAPLNPPRRSPPLSNIDEASRATPHAYAASSHLSGAPLILADAFSFGLERRFSADSGLGDSDGHREAPSNVAQLPSSLPSLARATVRERSRPNLAHRGALVPLQSNQTATSPLAEALNPPVFTASLLTYSLNSAQASLAEENPSASRSSSPQQSPPPLSRIEDLDRYRDLFYQPIASGSGRTSSEHRRAMSRDGGSPLGVSAAGSVSGASDLVAHRRQLDSELEAMQDASHLDRLGTLQDRPPRRMWGLRYGGMRGGDGMGSRTDPNVVLSITSDSEGGTTNLPLRLHQNLGRPSDASLTVNIPQDVESRRSSVLDRSEIEDADHDELLRVGTIEAVSTPAATTPTHRFSLAADIHRGRSLDSVRPSIAAVAAVAAAGDGEHSTLPPLLVVSNYHSGSAGRGLPSALPSSTTEVTRSSYTTNDTGTSRISGLSDFPVPPTQTSVLSDREAHSRPVPQKDDSPSAASSLPRPSIEGPSQLAAREPHVDEPGAP